MCRTHFYFSTFSSVRGSFPSKFSSSLVLSEGVQAVLNWNPNLSSHLASSRKWSSTTFPASFSFKMQNHAMALTNDKKEASNFYWNSGACFVLILTIRKRMEQVGDCFMDRATSDLQSGNAYGKTWARLLLLFLNGFKQPRNCCWNWAQFLIWRFPEHGLLLSWKRENKCIK